MENKTTLQEQLQEQLQDPNKNIALIVYGLQLIGVLTAGIAFVIAIILNYVKRDDVRGTWLESHFDWQIRTFWIALFWWVVGYITLVIFIGWIVMGVITIWQIYRAIKGLLNLLENKPMPIK